MTYPRVNCRKLMHVTLSLDIVILLFGISRGCFCHIYIVILISNFCYIFAVTFAVFIFKVPYIWPPGGVQFKGEGNVAVGRSLFVFHLAYLQSSAFSLISSSGNLAWLFTLVTWSSRVWRHSHLGLASLLVNKPICLPVIYASLPVRSFDLHAVT